MNLTSSRGLTVLEVLVASVILALTTASLVHLLTTADRLRGRGLSVSRAVLLASNELEKVRNDALYYGPPRDSAYEVNVGPITYEVTRKRVEAPRGVLGTDSRVQEMELTIVDKNRKRQYYFRFLQGYGQ